MKNNNSEIRDIKFINDCLLVNSIINYSYSDNKLNKKASIFDDVASQAKDYFMEHEKNESIIDMLAPGVIWTSLSAMGLGKIGMILGLLADIFHVDVSGIIQSVYSQIKAAISSGNKISPSEIDNTVNAAVQQHSDANTNNADDQLSIKDAKIFRDILVKYEKQQLSLTKEAGIFDMFKGSSKSKGANFLGVILKIIFKIALSSAGLLIVSDIANKALNRPNAFDKGTLEQEKIDKQTEQNNEQTIQHSDLPLSISLPPTQDNIDNTIVQFVKDIYPNLSGKEELIKQMPGFKAVQNNISWFNRRNNSNEILLPGTFISKKQMANLITGQQQ